MGFVFFTKKEQKPVSFQKNLLKKNKVGWFFWKNGFL